VVERLLSDGPPPAALARLSGCSRIFLVGTGTSYHGAVVLVTHDPGAAEALDPQRVVLLPDGTEDYWSGEYRDLIELA